ncbi:PIN domain-containing protein [Gracilinema caldarium]|uniref:PIN domain-containing protein n=1 Tax=Gracilinema caldarium TaxID=215591 RepID=UPI00068ADB1D|nr:PIN domain-containing protein [Gracilinema caldarium]
MPIKDLLKFGIYLDYCFLDLLPEDSLYYLELKEETHRDPFDRMLIAQCIKNKLIMISKDREFEKFKSEGLKVIW